MVLLPAGALVFLSVAALLPEDLLVIASIVAPEAVAVALLVAWKQQNGTLKSFSTFSPLAIAFHFLLRLMRPQTRAMISLGVIGSSLGELRCS